MTRRITIHDLLREARRGLRRLGARATWKAMQRGAVVVDTRTEEVRRSQGVIPGARQYPLSVLEWRLCPSAGGCDAGVSFDDLIIVVCAEGYSSSLAAARLQLLGFRRATDLIDGVAGWRAEGLPLAAPTSRPRSWDTCTGTES